MNNQPDNHIDKLGAILKEIIESVIDVEYNGDLDVQEYELEYDRMKKRAITQLDQHYADFYRNKILEARSEELQNSFREFSKVVPFSEKLAYYDNRLNDITAQFNSEEIGDDNN